MRQDQMANFFRRYGMPVIALVVIGLAALGGYLWWDHSSRQAVGESSEKLVVAIDSLEAGNLGAADKQLQPLAEEGGTANAVAASLLRAGIAMEQNRSKDAIAIYKSVAADTDAPQPYRDLATVREVAAGFDSMEPQQVIDKLQPLAKPGNPWFGVAGELVGIAYLKQGKDKLAGPLFAQISRDEDSPESLRRRARQMAGLLGVDAIDDVDEIAKANAPDAPEAAAQ
ncbi:MAG: tetratricopeptide repeat protein [Novosphingobium sp.]|nr:tetratricopeptide repeat protein [Novosphingobium sp.]